MQGFLHQVTMLRDISNNMAFIAMYFKMWSFRHKEQNKNRTEFISNVNKPLHCVLL